MVAFSSPDAARREITKAEKFRVRQRPEQAKRIAGRVLASFPEFYAGLHTYGLIEADLGNFNAALLALTKADAILPGQSITLIALAGIYLQLGHRAVARRMIERAMDHGDGDPSAYITLGEILRDERDYEAALTAYENALDLSPDWREARLCRAVVLTQLGRNKDAHRDLVGLLESNPKDFEAAAALVALPRRVIDYDIAQFLTLHEPPSPGGPENEQAKFAFFRANIHDRLGEYNEAWWWFEQANAVIHRTVAGKCRENARWQANSLQALRGAALKPAAPDAEAKTSLFILGPSRSGKTTAEAILARSPLVRAGYENPGFKNAVNTTFQGHGFVPTFQLSLLPDQLQADFRERYAAELSRRAGEAEIFTDTSPVKIHDAARIWTTIPNAKFIFVLRDRIDLALRIFQTHYSSGNFYGYDLSAIFEHIDWYADMIETLSAQLSGDCMTVRYEDIVSDPDGFVIAAERLLGRDLEINSDVCIEGDVGAAKPYSDPILEANRKSSENCCRSEDA